MQIAPVVAPTSAAAPAENGAEQDAADDREVESDRHRERDRHDIQRDVGGYRLELVHRDERAQCLMMAGHLLEREVPMPAERNHAD